MSHSSIATTDFRQLIHDLMSGEPVPWPSGEVSHADRIAHLGQPGRVVQVDEETYWWFLEVLPPRWMSGSVFAFAEGHECFQLFWQRGQEYFARLLSEAETDRFCQLTGASRSL